METKQKQSRTLIHNGALSPVLVSEKLSNIFYEIEMGWAVSEDIKSDYFGYSEEYIQKHPRNLMEYYDKFRIFANVVADHLYDAKMMLDELMEQIDEILEVSRENKNEKIIKEEG